MFLAAALAGFVASAGLIIAIGAQNAFVLRQGLLQRHVGVVVATCAFGDIALIICGVAGIGALVERWPALLQVMRFGGAAFLTVYGLMAARRAWQGIGGLATQTGSEVTLRRILMTCLAFTFLNPHVYLDTMVLLGSLSTQYTGNSQIPFAVGACIASVAWFSTLGFGARFLQPAFKNPRAWRILDSVVAAFMLSLAVALLLHPLS